MKDNSKEMRRLYDQWLSGSNSKALFCRQHKLKYTTFHYWVKKFGREDSLSSACFPDKGFSRISIAESTSSDKSILPAAVLTFPSGTRLEFFSPVEASYLKKLLS